MVRHIPESLFSLLLTCNGYDIRNHLCVKLNYRRLLPCSFIIEELIATQFSSFLEEYFRQRFTGYQIRLPVLMIGNKDGIGKQTETIRAEETFAARQLLNGESCLSNELFVSFVHSSVETISTTPDQMVFFSLLWLIIFSTIF